MQLITGELDTVDVNSSYVQVSFELDNSIDNDAVYADSRGQL